MSQQQGFVLGFVHRRRRGAELFLLVLALAVGIGAYAAVGVGVQGEVPPDIIGYGGGLAVLVIAAHVAIRIVAPYAVMRSNLDQFLERLSVDADPLDNSQLPAANAPRAHHR